MKTKNDPQTAEEFELFELAKEIEAWRAGRRTSVRRLVRQYPALGSDKTLKKLANGDTSQLKVSTWLPKYRSVWSLIERAETERENQCWEDLGPTTAVLMMVPGLLAHRGLNRLAIVEGESGSGKSKSLAAAAAFHPGSVILVEANESWKVAKSMVVDLLVGVGEIAHRDQATGAFDRLQGRLIEALANRRVLVCIDESQHMTGQGLTILKTLLNQTEASYLIAGQATLWRKLQATAWQEAKQLRFNRCYASLTLGAPERCDVELAVSRAVGEDSLEQLKEETWQLLEDYAGKYGNFAFLRDVSQLALEQVPEGDLVNDAALLTAAEQIKARAGGR